MSQKQRRSNELGKLVSAAIDAPWYAYIIAGGGIYWLGVSDNVAYVLWAVGLFKTLLRDFGGKQQRRAYRSSPEDAKHQTRSEELLASGKAYTRTRALMTEHEQRCYRHLQQRLPAIAQELGAEVSTLRIHSKVRVVDVVQPNSQRYMEGTRDHLGLFRQISQWHFDFVVCDDTNQKILLALELDDATHQLPDRVRRDRILDSVCRDARMPFTRLLMDRRNVSYHPVYPQGEKTEHPRLTGSATTVAQ